MRANLDEQAKLIKPRNIERGLARLKQLRHEIGRLVDEIRGRKEVSPGWEARAKKNLALLRSEAKQLAEWISHEHEKAAGRVLPCIISMGMLCAAHAGGAKVGDPCNVAE